MSRTIIIGGVAGGASAAARLRRLDENREIIMFEKGQYISYANCGLPYYIGGEIKDKSDLTLQTPESFSRRFNIDVRVNSEVIAINPNEKKVEVLNRLTGETYKENYDSLVLSPGAKPILPKIDGINSSKVFTLRSVTDTYNIKDFIAKTKPKKAVVVGAGFIGIEIAENLKNLDLDVYLIEKAQAVLPPIDYDMAAIVHRHLMQNGIKLILNNGVKEIFDDGSLLKITLNSGEINADMVIMAVGVMPDTKLAKTAGINVNEKGAIIVNKQMQTNIADIYAVGDAVQVTEFVSKTNTFIPLAGPANKQGRIAADNICGIKREYKGTQASSIVKVFDLTVASTGINEKLANQLGLNYEKSFTYSPNHASYYPGAKNMTIKIIFSKDKGKILGAQIVGYDGTDKRCDVIATAIRAGLTVYDLTDLELCYAPPYGSAKDPVNMVGYVAENILTGRVKIYHWHDVKKLPRDGSVTILDVRTEYEYNKGHIDGFINIPLDDLRQRINEIDKAKAVYVVCEIGLRGYIASRILTQMGYDCYNLSGGNRLYNTIFGHEINNKNNINTETQLPV